MWKCMGNVNSMEVRGARVCEGVCVRLQKYVGGRVGTWQAWRCMFEAIVFHVGARGSDSRGVGRPRRTAWRYSRERGWGVVVWGRPTLFKNLGSK